jgi:hypothetical protein
MACPSLEFLHCTIFVRLKIVKKRMREFLLKMYVLFCNIFALFTKEKQLVFQIEAE